MLNNQAAIIENWWESERKSDEKEIPEALVLSKVWQKGATKASYRILKLSPDDWKLISISNPPMLIRWNKWLTDFLESNKRKHAASKLNVGFSGIGAQERNQIQAKVWLWSPISFQWIALSLLYRAQIVHFLVTSFGRTIPEWAVMGMTEARPQPKPITHPVSTFLFSMNSAKNESASSISIIL